MAGPLDDRPSFWLAKAAIAKKFASRKPPVEFDARDSLCLVASGLYLSSCHLEAQKQLLQRKGVTHVLQVGKELSPTFPSIFSYKHIPVYDLEEEDLVKYFPECFGFIDIGRDAGAVLVHCAAGVSRSASVVIGYLMATGGLSLEDARAAVKASRPAINPNQGFLLQLQLFQQAGCSTEGWQSWNLESFLRARAAAHSRGDGPASLTAAAAAACSGSSFIRGACELHPPVLNREDSGSPSSSPVLTRARSGGSQSTALALSEGGSSVVAVADETCGPLSASCSADPHGRRDVQRATAGAPAAAAGFGGTGHGPTPATVSVAATVQQGAAALPTRRLPTLPALGRGELADAAAFASAACWSSAATTESRCGSNRGDGDGDWARHQWREAAEGSTAGRGSSSGRAEQRQARQLTASSSPPPSRPLKAASLQRQRSAGHVGAAELVATSLAGTRLSVPLLPDPGGGDTIAFAAFSSAPSAAGSSGISTRTSPTSHIDGDAVGPAAAAASPPSASSPESPALISPWPGGGHPMRRSPLLPVLAPADLERTPSRASPGGAGGAPTAATATAAAHDDQGGVTTGDIPTTLAWPSDASLPLGGGGGGLAGSSNAARSVAISNFTVATARPSPDAVATALAAMPAAASGGAAPHVRSEPYIGFSWDPNAGNAISSPWDSSPAFDAVHPSGSVIQQQSDTYSGRTDAGGGIAVEMFTSAAMFGAGRREVAAAAAAAVAAYGGGSGGAGGRAASRLATATFAHDATAAAATAARCDWPPAARNRKSGSSSGSGGVGVSAAVSRSESDADDEPAALSLQRCSAPCIGAFASLGLADGLAAAAVLSPADSLTSPPPLAPPTQHGGSLHLSFRSMRLTNYYNSGVAAAAVTATTDATGSEGGGGDTPIHKRVLRSLTSIMNRSPDSPSATAAATTAATSGTGGVDAAPVGPPAGEGNASPGSKAAACPNASRITSTGLGGDFWNDTAAAALCRSRSPGPACVAAPDGDLFAWPPGEAVVGPAGLRASEHGTAF